MGASIVGRHFPYEESCCTYSDLNRKDKMAYNWNCPHCAHDVTIAAERESISQHFLNIPNAAGLHRLQTQFIVCPNPECARFTLIAELTAGVRTQLGHSINWAEESQGWALVPEAHAKVFPDYIPAPLLADYREACAIRDLSPKASATLSRRCLQGIIRDFWKVKAGRLVDEIAAIKEKVDPVTWDAIEAVRNIGNIGAHMEKDINVIVDVDPTEAGLLIDLVETLLAEWYVQREERAKRMGSLVAAAAAKKIAATAPPVLPPVSP